MAEDFESGVGHVNCNCDCGTTAEVKDDPVGTVTKDQAIEKFKAMGWTRLKGDNCHCPDCSGNGEFI